MSLSVFLIMPYNINIPASPVDAGFSKVSINVLSQLMLFIFLVIKCTGIISIQAWGKFARRCHGGTRRGYYWVAASCDDLTEG
jgi:hypothetical protein